MKLLLAKFLVLFTAVLFAVHIDEVKSFYNVNWLYAAGLILVAYMAMKVIAEED